MKAVLMSVKSEWCEKILGGEILDELPSDAGERALGHGVGHAGARRQGGGDEGRGFVVDPVAAGQFVGPGDDDITLTLVGGDDEDGVDAASSLMIMTLGAEKGAEVVVTSDNADAVEAIAALIEKDLDA